MLKILLAVFTLLGCARSAALDNPLKYRTVSLDRRIDVPCYYTLGSQTDALVVEAGPRLGRVRVEMGHAIAGQLHGALVGLCRGTGRVRDRAEFQALTVGQEPAVLFEVRAEARMGWDWLWGTSTGSVEGEALVYGPGSALPLRYPYSGSVDKHPDPWTLVTKEMVGVAQGLRLALGQATQKLVDQAGQDRKKIEHLASSGRGGSR